MRTTVPRFAIVIFFLLNSCSLEPWRRVPKMENAIVGTWRQIDGPASMQFFKEGTVIITNQGKASSAYYEFADEETLKIEPKFRSKDIKEDSKFMKISIVQDVLTLTDPVGTVRLQRQKQ